MAKKTEEKDPIDLLPSQINEVIAALAKGLGVAATELWSIFVRQYFVRGVTEAFTGIVLCVASYFLAPYIGLWILIPLAVALGFFYGSILLIGNPKYYAIEDITGKIGDFKENQKKSLRRYY